ncbi:hypothetical protein, partial [Enterobacter cloacae complex sp. 4DZ3-17B2]|uniref:hypothetical protein n=1 Tax=Enterobacter cloacae complex sp. 4DZ3-17B2 TaxID=2511990 RepID=UPI001CA4CB2A
PNSPRFQPSHGQIIDNCARKCKIITRRRHLEAAILFFEKIPRRKKGQSKKTHLVSWLTLTFSMSNNAIPAKKRQKNQDFFLKK